MAKYDVLGQIVFHDGRQMHVHKAGEKGVEIDDPIVKAKGYLELNLVCLAADQTREDMAEEPSRQRHPKPVNGSDKRKTALAAANAARRKKAADKKAASAERGESTPTETGNGKRQDGAGDAGPPAE